ncbi:TIGR03943 family protein [Paenibacillus sp. UNCCL117]|uniref:TIGR03943 family putative permease subunit n=1 Tax=unclassified Paenibacillus TaxID=185978 RepID=UPI0008828A92|nr:MULTISPECIES: TIGR03943 family protein [unclassified Paenibacillus]SDE02039.1 TIGR03943 family protein [Paenibacillus sp. cl123]SFW57130.1 TIGR03943 family protein [Paenibacillus sp. UNCCL117]
MNPRTISLHHAIKALILFGFAGYIAYLVQTGRIILYIAPRMTDYVKWSALGLYATAAYQAYLAVKTLRTRHEPDCGCGHDHTPSRSVFKHTVVYGLFILPLLLGFMLPDSTLGSSLAAKKGMNLSSASSVKKDLAAAGGSADSSPAPAPESGGAAASETQTGEEAPTGKGEQAAPPAAAAAGSLDELFPSDKFTKQYADYAKKLYPSETIKVSEEFFMETLTSVDLYLDRFVGKKLELTGFVYRQEEMTDRQFVIGRFSIQCCSADAAPFGVLAEYDRAKTLETDEWVTVTGTIKKTSFNDAEIMVLQVEKVAKAEPAKTPYVYPNMNFGM